MHDEPLSNALKGPLSEQQWRRFKELAAFYVNGSLDRAQEQRRKTDDGDTPNPLASDDTCHSWVSDDQLFVQHCLSADPAAREWLAFCRHLRDTVQALDTPDFDISTEDSLNAVLQARTDRLLAKWRALPHAEITAYPVKVDHAHQAGSEQTDIADRAAFGNTPQISSASSRDTKLTRWWPALFGTGFIAATLTLATINPATTVLLHHDDWNGQADIELVLEQGITPQHEGLLASLATYQGKIVGHTLENDRYRIAIDLKDRSINQRPLIDTLQAQSHLDSYVLIASN